MKKVRKVRWHGVVRETLKAQATATSISVWQQVQLSEMIRPQDTLACCWDVKQPTNNRNEPQIKFPLWAQRREPVHYIVHRCLFVCWLLNVPATG